MASGRRPCLCRRCLVPLQTVAWAGPLGERYVRDFVQVEGRVLFYWVPEVLSDNVTSTMPSNGPRNAIRAVSHS